MHTDVLYSLVGCSPGKITKKYISRQGVHFEQRKVRRQLFTNKSAAKNTKPTSAPADEHYGPNAEDYVELEGEELERECQRKLHTLQVLISLIHHIRFCIRNDCCFRCLLKKETK